MLRAAAAASRGGRVDGELTLSVIRTRVAFVPSPTRRPAHAAVLRAKEVDDHHNYDAKCACMP